MSDNIPIAMLAVITATTSTPVLCAVFKGEVRRKMNFTYVLGFVALRDVVKVFPIISSSFARKAIGRNRA